LFHELGHGIHDLVAKTRYARFHGASTAPDFNEAPSQMLENWCWLSDVLRNMSLHYKGLCSGDRKIQQLDWNKKIAGGVDANKSLSETLIEQLVDSKRARNFLQCLALLSMGLFDVAIDQVASHDCAASLDTTMLYHQMMATVYGFDIPKEPPPSQAMDASHFTIDGIYIYLTYVVSTQPPYRPRRQLTLFRLQIATILL
jgi:metallopeptidase MepB